MNTILVRCNQCGINFQKLISEVNRHRKKGGNNNFCSIKCLSQFGNISRKNNTEEKIKKYYTNPKLCLNCKSVIDYKSHKTKTYCSHKCSATYTQRNGGHQHWSNEGKEKLRVLSKNNPKFYCWNKGLKLAKLLTINCIVCNKLFTKKESLLKNQIGVCSKECKSKIQSNNLLHQYKTGKKIYGGTTKWLKYKDIKVQGSYEYRTCIILDKWKELLKIKDWEYTNDRFQYIGVDGKTHNYLMDFKIWNNDGTFYYIETKGYEKENDKLKWKSVRDKGYKLEIWFNNDIKEKEFMATVA